MTVISQGIQRVSWWRLHTRLYMYLMYVAARHQPEDSKSPRPTSSPAYLTFLISPERGDPPIHQSARPQRRRLTGHHGCLGLSMACLSPMIDRFNLKDAELWNIKIKSIL